MLCMGISCFPCAIRSKFYFFYSIISVWRCFCQVTVDDSGRVSILQIASKRIILISIRTIVDTKNKRSYNESKSPGQKRKGAILMDYKRRILEMLEKITEPCILEKIYWYVQRLLLRK